MKGEYFYWTPKQKYQEYQKYQKYKNTKMPVIIETFP